MARKDRVKWIDKQTAIITPEQTNAIIEAWNNAGVSKTKGNGDIGKRMVIMVDRYGQDVVIKCIERYGAMYNDPDYFFDYKYSPSTFFSRMVLDKFIDDGGLWVGYDNFKSRQDKKNKPKETKVYNIRSESYSEWMKEAMQMEYCDYLNTDHWIHFRAEALKHYGNRCVMCNSTDTLHAHHKSYANRGRETFNDVIVICAECHRKQHGIIEEKWATD